MSNGFSDAVFHHTGNADVADISSCSQHGFWQRFRARSKLDDLIFELEVNKGCLLCCIHDESTGWGE